jgi:hypothetical protein
MWVRLSYVAGLVLCAIGLTVWAAQIIVYHAGGIWISLPIGQYIDLGAVELGSNPIVAWLLNVNIGYPIYVGGTLLMALSVVGEGRLLSSSKAPQPVSKWFYLDWQYVLRAGRLPIVKPIAVLLVAFPAFSDLTAQFTADTPGFSLIWLGSIAFTAIWQSAAPVSEVCPRGLLLSCPQW